MPTRACVSPSRALRASGRFSVSTRTPATSETISRGLMMSGLMMRPWPASGEQVYDRLGLQVVLEQVQGGALHVGAPVLLRPGRVPRLDQRDELHVGADDQLEPLVGVVVVALRGLGAQVGGDEGLQH